MRFNTPKRKDWPKAASSESKPRVFLCSNVISFGNGRVTIHVHSTSCHACVQTRLFVILVKCTIRLCCSLHAPQIVFIKSTLTRSEMKYWRARYARQCWYPVPNMPGDENNERADALLKTARSDDRLTVLNSGQESGYRPDAVLAEVRHFVDEYVCAYVIRMVTCWKCWNGPRAEAYQCPRTKKHALLLLVTLNFEMGQGESVSMEW